MSGDRGKRAPQTQIGRKRQSWMVQPTIRLLTGWFQVRILVAELFELVLAYGLQSELPASLRPGLAPSGSRWIAPLDSWSQMVHLNR